MRDELLKILNECLNNSAIEEDLSPIDDYGMDSEQLLFFLMEIEDRFQVQFDDFADLSNHMDSVGKMVDYLLYQIGKEIVDGNS